MNYNTSFLVFPKHCNNLREVIFGGAFMAEMDLAAAHCVHLALRATENGVKSGVTHKASFEFLKPSYIGDYLELSANIESKGKKSLVVSVNVKRRNADETYDDIAKGEFVFITIGDVSDLSSHPKFLPYREHELAD